MAMAQEASADSIRVSCRGYATHDTGGLGFGCRPPRRRAPIASTGAHTADDQYDKQAVSLSCDVRATTTTATANGITESDAIFGLHKTLYCSVARSAAASRSYAAPDYKGSGALLPPRLN
jgi:hypothetical protein